MRVVATVCDMGASKIKALQEMGATIRHPYFEYENQQILTIYDPPHLKCTRNLFLNYDVQFQSELMLNDLPAIDKCEHISNVYKWDKQNIARLIIKHTDDHLAHATQDTMKVSMAAQVMSHTVGASFACRFREHCSALIVCNKEQSDI
jgi:hypothetical protein